MAQPNPIEDYHDQVRWPVFPLLPATASRILDIGGGTGATAVEVKRRCSAAFAAVIDISDLAVSRKKPEIDFIECADIVSSDVLERVSRQHGPFDVILCLDVLEHLVDPWAAVRRIDAVLAPGGYFITSIPNVRHFSASARLLAGTWDYRDSGVLDRTHLRFFVKKTAIELATCSGMKVDALSSTRSPNYKVLGALLDGLTLGQFRPFFELQYVMRLKKASS